MFATYQEAVRKDIEQAFGQIVKKFDILSRSIWFQKKEVIGNVLNTCIILHNMTVQKQCKHYVSEWVYHKDLIVHAVEDGPLSLFGSLKVVGSPQVPFLMCTLEIPQKIAAQVLCS